MSAAADTGAVAFAERLLTLLDEASYSTTYKFAVVLGLLDLCIETAEASGAPTTMLTTRQLADKVVQIYWPQTREFVEGNASLVLRQSNTGQAEIVSLVRKFRERHLDAATASLHQARAADASAYERLVEKVEWKLIEMPLPRLQRLGNTDEPFIYRIAWDEHITQGAVRDYQRTGRGFDNRMLILDGAAEHLVQFGPLLRPLLRRHFADRILRYNRSVLSDPGIEAFLFDTQRTPAAPIRRALHELQSGACFYCRLSLTGAKTEVDHFIPWARYPDDSLANLVLAHHGCNNDKRHYLAAADHLTRWRRRQDDEAKGLRDAASECDWPHEPERTLSVARSVYLHLPQSARLWQARGTFVPIDTAVVREALLGA